MKTALLIGIILFSSIAWSESDDTKISPSEIYDELPAATEADAPPSPHESQFPTKDARKSDVPDDITSPPDMTEASDRLSSPSLEKTYFYLDNKALEEYIKSRSEPYVRSRRPVEVPDIEELRERLLATPTPAFGPETIPLSLSVNVEKMSDKWRQLEADFVIDYRLKTLYSSLTLSNVEDARTRVTVLKNSPSRETFPLKKGRYHITGTFWRPSAPEIEIKTFMGDVIVENRMKYVMTLDRTMEHDILREIETKIAERSKTPEDKTPPVINQPEEF